MSLGGTTAVAGEDVGKILRLAGAVEHGSEHPIGRAIAAAARQAADAGRLPPVAGFRPFPDSVSGAGSTATRLLVGRPRPDAALPEALQRAVDDAHAAVRTAVVVERDGRPVGVLSVGDLRPSSYSAAAPAQTGHRAHPVTGDGPAAARAVAEQVRIDKVHAEVTPEGKSAIAADSATRGAGGGHRRRRQ